MGGKKGAGCFRGADNVSKLPLWDSRTYTIIAYGIGRASSALRKTTEVTCSTALLTPAP